MKTSIIKTLCSAAIVLVLTAGLTPLRADQQVSTEFNLPIHVTANINEIGCNNSPGPQVTISGAILLGGFGVQLTFANNVKGTHTTTVTFQTNVVLLPLGSKITIPKQPVLGGVGGNPLVWIQFYNEQANLTSEIFLGRCVQGLKIERDFLDQVLAALLVTASGCQNHPGPTITFGGGLELSGLSARFIFRNNTKGTHTAEASSSVTIIPDDFLVKIPKQPVLGGSGGNPLIWIQFLQGDGSPIGDRQFLGRCNQL